MTTTTRRRTRRLCQHSGNYGPWYHVSYYEMTPSGAWQYVGMSALPWERHLSATRAAQLDLPYGRPRKGEAV